MDKPVGSQLVEGYTKEGQFWVIKIIQTDDDDKLYLYTKLKIENKLNSLQLFYIFAVKELLRACLHGGGGRQVGEVTRLTI